MISKPILSHRKARYQRILDELEEVSRVAIPEEGYELPSDKQLRHVMRLFALSSRRGRRGHFDAPFILMHKQDPIGKAELAEFVLKRLHLTPGREVGNAPPKKKTI